MEKIKFSIDLILLGNKHLHKAYIYCHMMKYGYVMIQLKKKYKSKRQMIANKKWQYNNIEKFNEMKRNLSRKYYNTNPNYVKVKLEYVQKNKEKIALQKKEYYMKKKQLLQDIQL